MFLTCVFLYPSPFNSPPSMTYWLPPRKPPLHSSFTGCRTAKKKKKKIYRSEWQQAGPPVCGTCLLSLSVIQTWQFFESSQQTRNLAQPEASGSHSHSPLLHPALVFVCRLEVISGCTLVGAHTRRRWYTVHKQKHKHTRTHMHTHTPSLSVCLNYSAVWFL